MEIETNPSEQTLAPEEKNLEISDEIKKDLLTAGKWAKFLAILGFIGMGLMVVAGFIMSIVMAFLPLGQNYPLPFPAFWLGFIYLVLALIYILPLLYLYRFATHIKQALSSDNQQLLTSAFRNLKAHYRFISILIIVMFCVYIVALIVTIFVGLFAGLASGVSNINA